MLVSLVSVMVPLGAEGLPEEPPEEPPERPLEESLNIVVVGCVETVATDDPLVQSDSVVYVLVERSSPVVEYVGSIVVVVVLTALDLVSVPW